MNGLGIGDCLKRFLCCFPRVYAWFLYHRPGLQKAAGNDNLETGDHCGTLPPISGYGIVGPVESQDEWEHVAGCGARAYGIKSDGSLWGWGTGLLGDGTSSGSAVPVFIHQGPWKMVSASANNATLAIKEDGTMWSWGDNSAGQLGLGRQGSSPGTSAPKARLSSSIARVDCSDGGMYSKTPSVSFFYKSSEHPVYWDEAPGPGSGVVAEAVMDYSLKDYRINVDASGSGYTSIPLVRAVEQQSPPKEEASVSLTVRFQVVSVEVQAGGSGYSTPPVVTVPGVSGFQATAVISGGTITAIEIQSPGFVQFSSTGDSGGQRTLPVVIAGAGVGASALAKLGNGYIVEGNVSASGSGYRAPISLEVPGSGRVSVRSTGKVVGVKIHNGGSGYTNSSTKVLSVRFNRDPQDEFTWGNSASGTPALVPAQATVEWEGDLSSYLADPFFTGRDGRILGFSFAYTAPTNLVSLEARIVGGGLSWEDGIPVSYSGGRLSYDGSSEVGFYTAPYIAMKISISTTANTSFGPFRPILRYESDDDPRKAIDDAWDVEYSGGRAVLDWFCGPVKCTRETITKETGDLVGFVNSLKGEVYPGSVVATSSMDYSWNSWWYGDQFYSNIAGEPELVVSPEGAEFELFDVFDGRAFFNQTNTGGEYRRASSSDLPSLPSITERCGQVITYSGHKRITVDYENISVTLTGHSVEPYFIARSISLPQGAFPYPKSSAGRAFFTFGEGREQGCFSVGTSGLQSHKVGGYWAKEPIVNRLSGGSIPIPQQIPGQWSHCEADTLSAVSSSGIVYRWNSTVPQPEDMGRPAEITVSWNKDSVPSRDQAVRSEYEIRGFRSGYFSSELDQRFFTMSPPQAINGAAAAIERTKRLCYEYRFFPDELPNDYFYFIGTKSSDEKDGVDGEAQVMFNKRPTADCFMNDFSTPPLTVYSTGAGYRSPPEILFSRGGEPLVEVTTSLAEVPAFLETRSNYALAEGGELWHLGGGWRAVDFDYKIVARKATFEASPLYDSFFILASTSDVVESDSLGNKSIWKNVSPYFWWNRYNYYSTLSPACMTKSPVNHETVESVDAVVGYVIVFDDGGSGFDNYSQWTIRVSLPHQLSSAGAFPFYSSTTAERTIFGSNSPALPSFPDEKGYKLAKWRSDESQRIASCSGGSWVDAPPEQSQYNIPAADLRIPSSCSHTTEYAIRRSQGNVTSHQSSPWMGSLIPPTGLAPGILYFNSISDLNDEPTVEFLCTSGLESYESLPSYRVIPVTGYLQSLGGQQKVDGSWSDFEIESGARKLYKASFPTYTGIAAPGDEAEFVKTNHGVGLKEDGSLWRLGTPGVSPSRVMGNLELKVVSPGSGYKSPPMAEVSPQLPGVATATATFDGKIVAVGIDNQGSGYRSPPQLTVSGGGQLQAVILGPVDSVTVTNGGSGYKNPPRVIFSTPGVSASGKASMKGSVASVRVVDGGEGYSAPPTISMGGNATATATIKGYIQGVIVNEGGIYSSAPSVNFSGGGGSGATAVAVMARSGNSLRVSSVVVTNTGSNYTSSPAVSFSGDGSGGAATAVLNASVDSVSLTSGGSGYGDHPTVTADGTARTQAKIAATCSLEVDSVSVVDGGSYRSAPTASFEAVGEISSVSLTSGGDGYSSSPEVKILGGLGSGAEATCTISASIQSFAITNRGRGYLYPPYVLISGGRRPGQSTQAKATAVLTGGSIASISVDGGGSGYYGQPTVAFKFPESAIANSSVSSGSVSGVQVLSGGCYYTDPPQVVFEGTGTGAAATAQVQDGVVTSVSITSGGSGYSTPPRVSFFVPKGGGGAAAAAVLSGVVDSISLVSCGINYDQDALPEVLFIGGGGSGASASLSVAKSGSGGAATTTISGSVIYAKIVSQGSGYQDDPAVGVSDSTNFIIQKVAQELADGLIDQDSHDEIVDASRAVIRAGVAGSVSGVTIQNAGQNYVHASGRLHNQHGERKPSDVAFRGPRLGTFESLSFASTQASTSTNARGGGEVTAVPSPGGESFTRRPTVHFCDTIGVSLSTRARVSSVGMIKGDRLDSQGYYLSTVFPWYGINGWPFKFESSPSLPFNSNYGSFNVCAQPNPGARNKAGSPVKGVVHPYDFTCSAIRAATFSGKFVRFPTIGVESSLGARELWSMTGGGEIMHYQDVPLPGQQKHSGDIQVIVLDPGVAEVLSPQFQVSISGGAVVSVSASGPARFDGIWGAGELVVHGGGGSGARLSLSVSSESMNVYVLDGGSGYTSAPSIKWVLPQQAYGFRMPDQSSPYPADDSKWKTRRPADGYLSIGDRRIEYVTGSTDGGYVSINDNDPFGGTGLYAFYKDGFVSDASLLDAGYFTQNFDGPAFLKHYTSPPAVTLYGGYPDEQATVQASVVQWTDKFSGKDGLCVAVRQT